jgi:hypothetical protein
VHGGGTAGANTQAADGFRLNGPARRLDPSRYADNRRGGSSRQGRSCHLPGFRVQGLGFRDFKV